MSVRLNELREQRGKALADARAVVEKAAGEKRCKNDDEQRQYDAYMKDVDKLGKEIEDEVRTQDAERESAAASIGKVVDEKRSLDKHAAPDVEKRTAAFRKFILEGEKYMSGDEIRAMTSGNDISGGFLNAPQEFINKLIVAVKNRVFMRESATVLPLLSGVSAGAPSLDNDVDDGEWTSEIKTVGEDNAIAFGKRELTPHPLAKLVTISNKLLRSAAMDPEAIVMDRIAYKFGIAMEKAYLIGDGSQKALGIFVASNDGIPISRDISEGNTATTIVADNLIATKYALRVQYMEKAKWLFHRDAIKQLAQLKDGEGRYIFDISTKSGAPDMLLGRPLMMSEYAPNTFTSGQYVGIFGDFSTYWIADSLSLQFQRLNELYALSNRVGFIGRMETDGMPTLAEAWARVKLG